ncbi:MAG: capsular polysaccharide biosynthesis protein [Verrucomicrobiales bacterium]|jgi:capsular polysaccharide biosynthesis protein
MDEKSDQDRDCEVEEKRYGIREAWRQKKGWFFSGAILTFLTILIASAVLIYVMPRDYTARVRLEIMRESQTFEVFSDASTRDRRSFEDHNTFIRNEAIKLSSKEVLYAVIEELQVVKAWDQAGAPSEAYEMLKERMEIEVLPGSSIIDITITHSDPKEAADIANAIAYCYRSNRTMGETRRSNNTLDMLNAQETLQEQKVENARQRMIELMEKFDIVDLGVHTNIVPGSDAPETASMKSVIDLEAAVAKAEPETSAIEARINSVLGLNEESRLLWYQQNDHLAAHEMKIIEEWDTLQMKLAVIPRLEDGEVPTKGQAALPMLRLQESILRKRIARMEVEHTSMIKIELEIAKIQFSQLQKIAENRKDTVMDERKRYTQYFEARKAFEAQNKVLQLMREALLHEKVDLSLPKSPINILEVAEMNEVPVAKRVENELKTAAVTGAWWAIPGGFVCMYLSLAFSRSREFEYVYEVVDESAVPEAVEVKSGADEDPSPY